MTDMRTEISVTRAVLLSIFLVPAVLAAGAADLSGSTRGSSVYLEPLASITGDQFVLPLKNPTALFYDEVKKRLYVSDSGNSRLVSYDEKFEFIAELLHTDMRMPTGVVKTKGSKFIVTDARSGEIKFVDPGNEVVKSFTLTGVPKAPHATLPGRLSIDGAGNIYVVDRMNARVIAVDGSGAFKRVYTAAGKGFYGFNDLRVTVSGELYALDSIGRKVYYFKSDGTLGASFSVEGDGRRGRVEFPTSLAVGQSGFVYILDGHGGKVIVYDRSGEFQYSLSRKGFNVGELHHPTYIFINRAGVLFITDGARVQVLVEVKR